MVDTATADGSPQKDAEYGGEPMKKLAASEQRRQPKLALKIHEIAKDCQNQNGLRHGDYHQYRQYCTRRLKRVRSSRDVRLMFGKGKAFVKKELTADVVTTSSHLEIPLMMAERAWSFAMQRKAETAGAPYRVRRHVVIRLSKAAKWASNLEALCLETADERTCLEATAYSAWMSGNLLLEKEAWREALNRFSTANKICQELGKVGRVEDQDLFTRRVEDIEPILRYCRYNLDSSTGSAGDAAAAEEHLIEMSREGANAGGDLLAAKLESVVAEARKKQASELDSVEWRGKKVAVRSEALRVALVKADELAARFTQSVGNGIGGGVGHRGDGRDDPKPGQYLKASLRRNMIRPLGLHGACDSPLADPQTFIEITPATEVFGAYDDALSTVAEEASRLQGKGGGMKMDAHRAELESLRAYAQHHKLRLMIQRNERLVQELQEKRVSGGGVGAGDVGEPDPVGVATDIVHVYDALLQSVRSMVTNVGGGDDAGDDVAEEKDELVESARADEARFRAFRCFFVIEAFSAGQKWAEASALFGHTRELAQEAADMLDDDDVRAESLAQLDVMVQGAWHRAAAHALLLKSKQEARLSAGIEGVSLSGGSVRRGAARLGGRPLQERLKEFDVRGRGSAGMEEGGRGGNKRSKIYLRIADFPPSLRLVPCKPRLLDLAYDELEFPDLDKRAGVEKVQKVVDTKASSARADGGGVRGWVGWALGRT